jgi:ABC-type methionine transport system ATPase subunit
MDTHELRFHLTFPQKSVTRPVLCEVVKRHDIVFNIRRADISEGTGTMDLSFAGTHEQIEKAVRDMIDHGVEVDPIERNVIE